MPLFRRNQNKPDESGEPRPKKKSGWKRPEYTTFKQQRLKAWHPILTPKLVLPTLFIIGILVFAPIGGVLVWGSSLVTEITVDYSDCDTLTPASNLQDAQNNLVNAPNFNYRLRSSESDAQFSPPQYAFIQNSSASDIFSRSQCVIHFDIPFDLDPTVLLYYKLTHFFQNHRRYVKSYDTKQLRGDNRTRHDLKNSDCKPLAIRDNKVVYPCGLVANSLFNDTFSSLTSLNQSSPSTYELTDQGIARPSEAKRYTATPGYNLDEIVPPANWALRFPNGYTNDTPPPDLRADQHFQNWMRVAGLPTFTKLYGRNDNDKLLKGRYEIVVGMNFPVRNYDGTKSIVISTVSWMGGKNPFLGWANVVAAAIFVVLGAIGTLRHLFKPRRLGDMTMLSWNR